MNLISIYYLKMNYNLFKVQKSVAVDFNYQNYMISSYLLFAIDLNIGCNKEGKHFLQINANFIAKILLVKTLKSSFKKKSVKIKYYKIANLFIFTSINYF